MWCINFESRSHEQTLLRWNRAIVQNSAVSYGGATKTDGQSDDNRQRSFNMGATLGFQFSAEFGLKLTYGKTIDHNDDGWDGDFARLVLTYNQL